METKLSTHLDNLSKSVERLTAALNHKPTRTNGDLDANEMLELIRLATLRRVVVCFIGYMNYLTNKTGISAEALDALKPEEMVDLVFKKGILRGEDIGLFNEFLDLYGEVTEYNMGIATDYEALFPVIHRFHDYLRRFVVTEQAGSQPRQGREQATY